MNLVLWIAQIVLAFMFLMAGSMKVAKSREEMQEQFDWVEDFSGNTITFIGVTEILGAIGLILPALTGIAPVLVPVAATGLSVVMLLALIVHYRRSEMPNVVVTGMLLLLAAFVAWGRFGDYAL